MKISKSALSTSLTIAPSPRRSATPLAISYQSLGKRQSLCPAHKVASGVARHPWPVTSLSNFCCAAPNADRQSVGPVLRPNESKFPEQLDLGSLNTSEHNNIGC